MVYLAFGFEDPDEATTATFCLTAAQLGCEEAHRWSTQDKCTVLCTGVPLRDKSYGLDLYDALCRLVERGEFPLWISLLYPSKAEWEAGETLPLEAK